MSCFYKTSIFFDFFFFDFKKNKTKISAYIGQSNLNYILKKPVVMIAVIQVVGTPCSFRTYGLGHLLLVSVRF